MAAVDAVEVSRYNRMRDTVGEDERMSNRIMIVPEPVRRKVATLGAEGVRWLVGLPDLIGALEQEWQLTVESALAGGSEAYVG